MPTGSESSLPELRVLRKPRGARLPPGRANAFGSARTAKTLLGERILQCC